MPVLGKFRFVALMHFIGEFIRLRDVSTGPPRQAAQPAFSVICTPESTHISIYLYIYIYIYKYINK